MRSACFWNRAASFCRCGGVSASCTFWISATTTLARSRMSEARSSASAYSLPLPRGFALLLEVVLAAQRRFDARARVARHQPRRLARQRLHQLAIFPRQLHADLVGNLGQRSVALVAALADEPLPEELLVEHLL